MAIVRVEYRALVIIVLVIVAETHNVRFQSLNVTKDVTECNHYQ